MDTCILGPANLTQLTVKVVKVMEVGITRPDTTPQAISEVVEIGQV